VPCQALGPRRRNIAAFSPAPWWLPLQRLPARAASPAGASRWRRLIPFNGCKAWASIRRAGEPELSNENYCRWTDARIETPFQHRECDQTSQQKKSAPRVLQIYRRDCAARYHSAHWLRARFRTWQASPAACEHSSSAGEMRSPRHAPVTDQFGISFSSYPQAHHAAVVVMFMLP
jgi:hypothetical protein